MQGIEAPVTAVDEVSKLKQQLAERELSVMRAILANSELQQKVADAEEQAQTLKAEVQKLQALPSPAEALAEITRLKKEWLMTQKAQQREHAERRSELVKVRSLLHQTQKKYEDESRARRTEAAQASATIARMDRDMGDLRLQAKKTRDEAAAGQKSHWKYMAATVVATLAVCAAVLTWPSHSGSSAAAAEIAPVAGTVAPAAGMRRAAAQPSGPVKHLDLPPANFSGGTSGPEFSSSLARLNDALSGVTNRTPEQILREVHLSRIHEEPDLCAFQWNEGQPSLMFNSEGQKTTIAASLGRCAQAVNAWKAGQAGKPAPHQGS